MPSDKLNDEQEHLEQELEKAREELASLEKVLESKADYDLGEGDPSIYEWELNLARRERLEEKIGALESALERLKKGTYGICEECGEKIDPERLQILPQTALCVRCAGAKQS